MALSSLIIWVLVGGVAGFVAEWLVGDVRTGCIGTVVIGIVGGLAGGALFDYFQISLGLGGIAHDLISASVGALALLLLFKFIRLG
jgi:uncharacterized membrane protein YeaQ/YmgE (transglycosylase-associated protein family)